MTRPTDYPWISIFQDYYSFHILIDNQDEVGHQKTIIEVNYSPSLLVIMEPMIAPTLLPLLQEHGGDSRH